MNNSKISGCNSWNGIKYSSKKGAIVFNNVEVYGANTFVRRTLGLAAEKSFCYLTDCKLFNNLKIVECSGAIDLLFSNSQFNAAAVSASVGLDLYDMNYSLIRVQNNCIFNNYPTSFSLLNLNATNPKPNIVNAIVKNSKFNNTEFAVQARNTISVLWFDRNEFLNGYQCFGLKKSSIKITNNKINDYSYGVISNEPVSIDVSNNRFILNSIYNISHGIEIYNNSRNGNIIINDDTIKNFLTNSTGSGIQITNPIVLNNDKTSVNRNLLVSRQSSGGFAIATGIGLNSMFGGKVTENDITTHAYQTGIYLSTSQSLEVSSNKTTGTSSGGNSIGIHLVSSDNNLVKCNRTDGTYVGINSTAVNSMTNLMHNSFGNSNFPNSVAHQYGLLIRADSYIGRQKQKLNKWPTNYGVLGALNDNDPMGTFYQNSQFSVRSPYGTLFHPTNSGFNFFQVPFIEDISLVNFCPNLSPLIDPDDEFENLVHMISDTSTGTPASETVRWISQKNAVEYLIKHPTLLSASPLFTTFFNNHANSTIRKFVNIEQNWLNKHVGQPNSTATMDNLANTMDSIMINDTTQQFTAELATANLAFVDKFQENQNYQQLLADQQATLLNEIITTNIIEENLKKLYSVYFSTIAKEIDTLTNQQMSDIQTVAQQCPAHGGNAVLMARNLLAYVTHTYTEYPDTCANAIVRGQLSQQPAIFAVFPNPASTELQVTFVSPATEKRVDIYNLQGQRVAQVVMDNKKAQSIDVSQFATGMYVLKFIENNILSETRKVSIIR